MWQKGVQLLDGSAPWRVRSYSKSQASAGSSNGSVACCSSSLEGFVGITLTHVRPYAQDNAMGMGGLGRFDGNVKSPSVIRHTAMFWHTVHCGTPLNNTYSLPQYPPSRQTPPQLCLCPMGHRQMCSHAHTPGLYTHACTWNLRVQWAGNKAMTWCLG